MSSPIEGIKGGKLKERIVTILAVKSPLSAKMIYTFLMKDYQISITYQAVHKAIVKMVSSGILIDKKSQYKINVKWLKRIDSSAERISAKHTSGHIIKKHIKVISFDLDGCLSDNSFDEMIWRKKIPEIYACEKGIPFEQAFQEVTSKYKRLWGNVAGWRNVEFWFKRFKLKTKWTDAIDEIKENITCYGDVLPVLQELKKHYVLIIVSHADRKFLDLKINVNKIDKFFDETHSTITDFNEYKKTPKIFIKICKGLGIKPSQMVHVGDSHEYDYQIPTSVGIMSYVIDRIGVEKEDYIVRDLFEFKDKLLK